ncbi:hypothetical protein Ae717Ps2_5832 [Pseudonocardia sp. Ae717_Ps2]|uniref:transglycosylase family protein n=1 Tax=Pseudonocardia sp. Ae717_Ps2 TaxID=1885573 RepID=UPI0009645E7E|nr:hypothetical protein Ae717Ps2_5832 [Pseudonocardia sp. Ae717_Ps2]
MFSRSAAFRSASVSSVVVRRSAVAALAAGAMLGGTALTPALLGPAAAAEEHAAVALRVTATGPSPAVDTAQVHAQARALLTDLALSDSPHAQELARKLVGLGVSPATRPAGWRQQAVDVSDRLHAVHGTHRSLDVVAVELAAAGFGPTPASLRILTEPPPAAPPGAGPVGVLGGLTDAGHAAVDAVGAAGGAVADVVTGPAPVPSSATPAPRPVAPQPGRTPPVTSAPAPTPSAAPAPPPTVPVQPAAATASLAPDDSSSGTQSAPSATTSRPEDQSKDHGQENDKDHRSDAADQGRSVGVGRGGGEQGSRRSSDPGGSGTNTATSTTAETDVEAARAAVALLSDFLTALDAEPVSTSSAADEVDRVRVAVDAVVNRPEVRAELESLGADPAALDAAAATVAGGDRGSVAAAGSGAAIADTASSGRPGSNADTAGGEQRAGGRDDGTFDTAGQGAAHRGEGLAAGVEKLTEQAARAAVADPDAVALLETLTDPDLNLDDLDTTNTSGTSAGSAGNAGETISRTNSATPAPEPVSADAANGQESAGAQPSPTSAPEKRSGAVPERVWDELVECESGGDWSARTGNGFSGGLQFTPSTWTAFGGQGEVHEASRAEQIAVAQRVQEGQGWKAWPSCAKKLGLTD